MNMMFLGDPGVGKTTVARHYGEIFKSLGLLQSGHIVEVSRADLIGQYIGDTEQFTKSIFESALDGILFIDEAHNIYNPASEVDFGKECLATLIKLIEDYRERIVVIFAGYEIEMNATLLSFTGMKSRIPHTLKFGNYSAQDLTTIFFTMVQDKGYFMQDRAEIVLQQTFSKYLKSSNEKLNARIIRNMVENAILRQAQRVVKIENPTDKEIQEITVFDIELPRNYSEGNIVLFSNNE